MNEEDYQRRLRNAEKVIIGMVELLEDYLAPACSESLNRMVEDYFYSISDEGTDGPLEPPK